VVGALVNDHDVADTDGILTGAMSNAALANLTTIFSRNFSASNGGGISVVTGEKAVAGLVGSITGTFTEAVKSIGVSIALKPVPPPPGSTGSGTPTKTLSISAVGVGGAHVGPTGSGAPTKTLSISAVGVAAHITAGTGAPTKTLSISASGEATRALDVEVLDGDVEVVLTVTARGTAYSNGIPVTPPRPPRTAAGGSSRRRYVVVPEKEEKPRKRRKKRTPPPVPEAAELPAPAPHTPLPFAPRLAIDPMAWQVLTTPTRFEMPVRPQWEIDEEEEFLKHLLESDAI
jgi:predicted outer membrane repeat protein